LFNRKIGDVATVARDTDSLVYSVVHWGMASIKHVQAFTKEDEEHRRFMDASGAALHAHRLLYSWQSIYSAVINTLVAAGTGFVLFVGAREVLGGALTIGELLVFITYLDKLYAPVNQITQSWGLIAGARIGAKRCFEILDTEPDLADGKFDFPAAGATGRIEWRGVNFRYRTDQPVLRGIDLAVEPGQTIALVGATGAGKSTLLGLLARFFDPSEGEVLIDGIDAREYRLASLRRQSAMVLQPPIVFPLSVRDNIAYGRPEASFDEVKEAARLARIDQTIEALPQGWDTIVGEAGANFSEGEKQRLTIARAILRAAPILILDEPTSALDAETEALVMQGLERLTRGRTTFIIAHRLSTVRRADKILVLKDGVIAETGGFAELMRLGGLFAALYDTQFAPLEETRIGV
jgi:ATP-binding cassette subfamily B protein